MTYIKQKRLARNDQRDAEAGTSSEPDANKIPENKERFRDIKVESDPHGPVVTFFYPDCYCRPRSFAGSCS